MELQEIPYNTHGCESVASTYSVAGTSRYVCGRPIERITFENLLDHRVAIFSQDHITTRIELFPFCVKSHVGVKPN